MSRRAVSIGLKIPDNTAYTALVTLRRLCVDVHRLERSEIYFFESSDAAALAKHVAADETIFNPNKHRLAVLDEPLPRAGEVWIEPLGARRPERATAWRLFDESGAPASAAVLDAAIERLLCNPAIDRAVTGENARDRDNGNVGE
jgi:hypothetical protein